MPRVIIPDSGPLFSLAAGGMLDCDPPRDDNARLMAELPCGMAEDEEEEDG